MEFEYQRNTMQGTFDFVALEARVHKIKEQLVRSFLLLRFLFSYLCSFPVYLWYFSMVTPTVHGAVAQMEEMNDWRSQGEMLSAKEALSANGETYACQQVNSAFQVIFLFQDASTGVV